MSDTREGRVLDIKTSFWWRNGRPKYAKKTGLMQSQVINETHSTEPSATARAQNLPTYQHKVQISTNNNFPCLKCEQACRSKYVCDPSVPAVVPQPRCVPGIPHCSRDVGGRGQEARIQDLHRAGAHEQQHICAHVAVRELHLLHGCLHHRHGSCSVCCEDLAAEERICNCCDFI